jgi:uncharacterized membrane protein YqhA
MDTSILWQFNNFLFTALNVPSFYWAALEMVIAVPVFFLCIWQRLHSIPAKTSSREHGYVGVVLSQIALYLHMILALLCVVDGYQCYITPIATPHVAITIVIFSLLIRKIGIFLTYDKLFTEIV